jgi:hypothetical protein
MRKTYSKDFNAVLESLANRPSPGVELTEREARLVSYGLYCRMIDGARLNHLSESVIRRQTLAEGLWDDFKQLGLPQKLIKVFAEFKDALKSIIEQFKLSAKDVYKALKSKDAFAFMRAIKFNLWLALKAITAVTGLVRKGILSVFQEIYETGAWQKIKSGVMKVDELLDKYPLLKHVAGIAVAGLLIYIWLNMTFIGDADFDFDLSAIAMALAGSFTLVDLFASPSGMMMLGLLMVGLWNPLMSFPWLGASIMNLLVALLYTLFKRLRLSGASSLKTGLVLKKV